jgi:hypothetical protein
MKIKMKEKVEVIIGEESAIMKQLRQPDQHYIDRYDWETIKKLRLLEKELPSNFDFRSNYTGYDIFMLSAEENSAVSRFFSEAISRARLRESTIRGVKEWNIRRNRLIKDFPAPKSIYCNTCKREMFFDSHIFKDTLGEQILFVFSCPAKHKPKKVVYPNGREYQIKETKCDCGGRLEHSSIRKDNLLILIDICTLCGKEEVMELDTTDEIELLIDEDERRKYCLQFLCIPHYLHDLESFQNVVSLVDKENKENETRKLYDVDKIQKMNVPALEALLKNEVESAGYTKFEFTKTDLSKFIIITFLLNDPLERTKNESIKQLSKLLNTTLFPLNWRLISNSIEYRLGVLSGRIRAYEMEVDLLELAKKIHEKNKAKNS